MTVFGRPSSPVEPVTPPPVDRCTPTAGEHAGGALPPDVPVLWVRVCADCGAVDHLNAWGSPAVVDGGPWACRSCPATAWVLRQLSLDR